MQSTAQQAMKKPVRVDAHATVLEAVQASLPEKAGAVVVMNISTMVGILSERDVMTKVVAMGLKPEATQVKDVMTSPVFTVPPKTPLKEVLKTMLDLRVRHLPVSEDGKTLLGILSLRVVLQAMLEDSSHSLAHMEAYLNADGIGG